MHVYNRHSINYWVSLVAYLVKNLPAMQETWVWSLGWEDPLEKKIPWGRSPGYPFQHSGLENSMDCIVHGLTKSQTWLSDFHFATLWTIAYQAPLSTGPFREEYWSGLPFPSPGSLPNSGIDPTSPATPALAGRFFTTEPPGKPQISQ